MEISNYKVEILGGEHTSNPQVLNNSSSWFPLSAWAPFSWNPKPHNLYDRSYVVMRDGQAYVISLTNNNPTKCHAVVSIDGQKVGTWLLEPWQTAAIERPVDIPKKFTFFKVSSQGGMEAGLLPGESKNGLVTVEFIPAKLRAYANFREESYNDDCFLDCSESNLNSVRGLGCNVNTNSGRRYGNYGRGAQGASFRSEKRYEAGGTGLKGKSNQNFVTSNDHLDLDYDSKVTINLRLIARKDPDIDYERVTPLGVRSNPVPPMI